MTLRDLNDNEKLLLNVITENNNYVDILVDNYFLLKNNPPYEYINSDLIIIVDKGKEVEINEAFGIIWCFFVELYGEYGLDQWHGWLYDVEGFRNFIDYMIIHGSYGLIHSFKERKPLFNENVKLHTSDELPRLLKNDYHKINKISDKHLSLSEVIEKLYDNPSLIKEAEPNEQTQTGIS